MTAPAEGRWESSIRATTDGTIRIALRHSVYQVRPKRRAVVEVPEPAPGPYQAKVRTELSCLYNSTDTKLIEGHFPGIEAYPLLLGHETVGVVESVGAKVRSFRPGDRVVGGLLPESTEAAYASGFGGFGGFSEYVLAGDHAAMLADGVADEASGWVDVYEIQRVVPPQISVEAALMLCTWREVYAAFDDFRLRGEQAMVIVGAGPVGLSFARFASLLGFGYVGVVDRHASKRRKAEALGANEVFASLADLEGLPDRLGRPLDAVVDAVGSEQAINAALPLLRSAGSICVYGVIGADTVRMDKHRGPYNFNLPGPPVAHPRPGVRRPGTAVRLDRAGSPRLPAVPVGGVPGDCRRPGNRPPRYPRGEQDLPRVLIANRSRNLPKSPAPPLDLWESQRRCR